MPPEDRICWDKKVIHLRKRIPIFYSALLLTGVNLLLRLVATSFQVYISGRIGASGGGLLQLVLSVGSMSMTAGMAGIRTATMYLTAEELGRNRSGTITWVLTGCFLYSLLCSSLVGLGIYLAAPTLASNWIGHPQTVQAIRLFSFFLPVVCLSGVMSGYFTAANRIGTLAAVEVAEQLCSMAVTMVMLTFWAGTDPVKACYGVILGSSFGACLTFLCLLILRLLEREKPGSRIPVARRLADTAVPLALADDLKAGISTTENLMVPRRLALYTGSEAALAQFGTVCGMVFPVMMFPAAILFGLAELLIPELARCNAAGSRKRIHYLVHRSLRVAMLYGVTFSGLLYLLSRELGLALYDNAEAGRYLRWFSILVPMLYCDAITDAMTKGLGQQKACVRYNILTSGLDVIFLYFLLPKYGVGGYFLSFFVTHLLNFILSLRRLLRMTGQRIPVYVPATVLSVQFLSVWAVSHLRSIPGRILGFPTMLFSALTLLGIVRKEDLDWLTGLLRRK